MPNPIVDPLVEVVDSNANSPLVHIDSSLEGIEVVTLNRPDRKNAFNAELIAALHEAFETLRGAEGVRVVLIRGAGDTFCAGADLEWMRDAAGYTESENREDAFEMAKMLKALWDLPALTVAMIHGGAFGGGAGLAAACDVALATRDAKFSFSEVRLGLIAATISPYVVAAVGPRTARTLFATGRVFDAAYAERVGLITEAADDFDALGAAAERIIDQTMACGPQAVAESKRLVSDVVGRHIDRALMEETARRIARVRVSPEGQEGVRAFLERRKPGWAQQG
ncbi:MAG: enoyl-CoA hydratase-related protein [Phenylobacterium sp.]|uniref:enoyl-CoA hydratase-related protein n=1 Tax=Phenylobacterium sp. TaxID=1871053 RepID=UPI00391BD685